MVTTIKPKTNFDEAYPQLITNFSELYELIDKRIACMDKIKNDKSVLRIDRGVALECSILLHGQKMLLGICEDHAKFIYGIRDLVSEYGFAINTLTKNVEDLAKQSTDKELTNRVLSDLVYLKNNVEKVKGQLRDTRFEVEHIDKDYDDFFRNLSQGQGEDD